MTEEEKAAAASKAAQDQAGKDEAFKKLSDQVENLNKGIGTYRDEAQKAAEIAKKATEELEALKKSKAPVVELSDKDEEKFRAYAEKHGLVTESDLATERAKFAADNVKNIESTAVTEFLEKHPEYDDDEKWKEVMAEFNLYKTPTNITGYRQLLEKVRKNLGGDSVKDRAKAEARAEIINKSRLSLGGGRQGGASGDEAEKTLEKYQAKYPSLSRDQIEQRLSEIRALAPKKK